jgi:hypothetical protein
MADSPESDRRAAEIPRVLNLVMPERDLIDLAQILADGEGDEALAFLRKHLQHRLTRLLEGG